MLGIFVLDQRRASIERAHNLLRFLPGPPKTSNGGTVADCPYYGSVVRPLRDYHKGMPHIYIVVVELPSKHVVGLARCMIVGKDLEIEFLCGRGNGGGSLAIMHADQWAQRRNFRRIFLHSTFYAQPFYQRLGFSMSEPATKPRVTRSFTQSAHAVWYSRLVSKRRMLTDAERRIVPRYRRAIELRSL